MFLGYLGAPLLAAWGLWSMFGWRHWALRLALYVALLVAFVGGLILVALQNLPIL